MDEKTLSLRITVIVVFGFMVVCSLFEPLFYMTFMIQPIGLIVVIIATHLLVRISQRRKYGQGERTNTGGVSSLLSGTICCLYVALSCAHLYIYHYGQDIRAMGWAGFVSFVALIGVISGLYFSISGLIKDRKKLFSLGGLVLGFCPWPLASLLLHLGSWLGVFGLKP